MVKFKLLLLIATIFIINFCIGQNTSTQCSVAKNYPKHLYRKYIDIKTFKEYISFNYKNSLWYYSNDTTKKVRTGYYVDPFERNNMRFIRNGKSSTIIYFYDTCRTNIQQIEKWANSNKRNAKDVFIYYAKDGKQIQKNYNYKNGKRIIWYPWKKIVMTKNGEKETNRARSKLFRPDLW